MLVLSRRLGEEVIINGNIRVTIVGISSDRVRLGITAPQSIPIDRQEIHERRATFGAEPTAAKDLSALGKDL